MSIFSLIGNGLGALGNIVSTGMANSSNQKIAQQTNETNIQLAREANDHQTQLQQQMNDFNKQMWQENNEYNSLGAQLERARAAGVNPNAIVGGEYTSAVASPVQQSSLPQSFLANAIGSTSLAPDVSALGRIAQDYADYRNKNADADLKEINKVWLPQVLKGNVQSTNMSIDLMGAQKSFTEEQQRNIAQSTMNLQKQIDVMDNQIAQFKQSIANMQQDEISKKIENFYKSDLFQKQIDNLVASSQQMRASANASNAQAQLSRTQAEDILKTQIARIANLESQTRYNNSSSDLNYIYGNESNARIGKIRVEEGRLKVQLGLDEKYGDAERIINMGTQTVGAITDCISAVKGFIPQKSTTTRYHDSWSDVDGVHSATTETTVR